MVKVSQSNYSNWPTCGFTYLGYMNQILSDHRAKFKLLPYQSAKKCHFAPDLELEHCSSIPLKAPPAWVYPIHCIDIKNNIKLWRGFTLQDRSSNIHCGTDFRKTADQNSKIISVLNREGLWAKIGPGLEPLVTTGIPGKTG